MTLSVDPDKDTADAIRCVRGTSDAGEPREKATLVSAICVFVSQLNDSSWDQSWYLPTVFQ